MKKIIICAVILITATATFSQQTNPSPSLTKQDYLKKSSHQEGAGVFLTLAGSLTIYSSTIKIWGRNLIRTQLLVAGIAEIGGSIILFIASSRNKHKAASVSLNTEPVPQIYKSSMVYRSIPSLTLKFRL